MNRIRTGQLSVILAYVSWGLLPAFWKLLSSIDPRIVLLNRCAWAAVVLGLILLVQRLRHDGLVRVVTITPRVVGMLFGASLLLTVNWLTYLYAIEQKELVAASLGYLLCPIFTILLGAFGLGEKLSSRQWFGIALMASGLLVRAVGLGKAPWFALFLAGSFSCYTMIKKKVPLGAVEALFIESILMIFPAAALAYAGDAHLPEWNEANMKLYLLLLSSGPVTAIPLMLLSSGARQVSMRFIGLTQYLTPMLILFSAVVWCGEQISEVDLLSFPIVGMGIAVFLSSVSFGRRGLPFVRTNRRAMLAWKPRLAGGDEPPASRARYSVRSNVRRERALLHQVEIDELPETLESANRRKRTLAEVFDELRRNTVLEPVAVEGTKGRGALR